jgi:choline-sulfatase
MATEQPNVLVVCTDQHRFDWVGMNPDVPVRTPNLESLADRGRWFRDAVTPTPVCNPARSCIASGMEYDRCGVPNNEVDYDPGRGTLYRRLRDEAGYHVAGCGKFDLTADYGLGMDGRTEVTPWGFSDAVFNPAKNETVSRVRDADGRPRGPYTRFLADRGLLEAHVEDYERRAGDDALRDGKLVATEPTSLPDDAYYDEWIAGNGRRLLERAPADRPWFLQVNFQNPHDPWDITERMHDRYRDPPVDLPEPTGVEGDDPVDVATHRAVRRNYAAMVEHLDSCLGDLLDAVEARGELDETLVVFVGDHGEMLGDHGQWQKDSPLHASVGVPLVVAGPGVADADPCDAPVTILDLHATVLDYAGVDPGEADSRSMRALLADRVDRHRDVVYSGLSTWRMVYDGRFKLVRGYDPGRRDGTAYEPRGVEPAEVTRLLRNRDPVLYDRRQGEETDVADEHPDRVAALTTRLDEIRHRA